MSPENLPTTDAKGPRKPTSDALDFRVFGGQPIRAGFTLLELLISMSMLSFLAVMLFSVLSAVTTLWRDNEARVDGFREARAALNLMAREVSQAFRDPEGNLPVMVIDPSPAEVSQPAAIERDATWGHRVFLLATLSAETQESGSRRSDLCALGYYLAFTRDQTAFSPNAAGAGDSSYKLYRHFRSSDPTFTALQPPFAPMNVYLPSPTPSGDEVLARNITQFEIAVWRRKRDAVTEEFMGMERFDLSAGSWPVTETPAMIELALTALNSETASKLATQAEWTNHNSPLQTRQARRFVTRVVFPE